MGRQEVLDLLGYVEQEFMVHKVHDMRADEVCDVQLATYSLSGVAVVGRSALGSALRCIYCGIYCWTP